MPHRWVRRMWGRLLGHRTPPVPSNGEKNNSEAARAARQDSERRLHKAQQDQQRVKRVVETTRELKRRNHFGEDIEKAFRRTA